MIIKQTFGFVQSFRTTSYSVYLLSMQYVTITKYITKRPYPTMQCVRHLQEYFSTRGPGPSLGVSTNF